MKVVILDFDGTICRLFANYDLNGLILKLQDVISKYGIKTKKLRDCFEVFEVIEECIKMENIRLLALAEVDKIITDAECEAVENGIDVVGVEEFISYCSVNNISIGIATNNSKLCIEKYLRVKNIVGTIPIVARDVCHLDRMKPSPWMMNEIKRIFEIDSVDMLFIGDNPSDYQCACAAGVNFIGITVTEKKRQRFQQIQQKVLLKNSYAEIIEYFCERQDYVVKENETI